MIGLQFDGFEEDEDVLSAARHTLASFHIGNNGCTRSKAMYGVGIMQLANPILGYNADAETVYEYPRS